jgi:hypothetical protein
MRILPSDLGEKWHVALVQRRSCQAAGSTETAADPPSPRLGFLGKLWSRGSGLSEERAAAALPAAAPLTMLWWVLTGLGSFLMTLFWAVGGSKHGMALGKRDGLRAALHVLEAE